VTEHSVSNGFHVSCIIELVIEVAVTYIDVNATPVTSSIIQLTWNPFETECSVTGYQIDIYTGSVGGVLVSSVNLTPPPVPLGYAVTNLDPSTTYYFKVTPLLAGEECTHTTPGTASVTTHSRPNGETPHSPPSLLGSDVSSFHIGDGFSIQGDSYTVNSFLTVVPTHRLVLNMPAQIVVKAYDDSQN
jgi:hypothetical protein